MCGEALLVAGHGTGQAFLVLAAWRGALNEAAGSWVAQCAHHPFAVHDAASAAWRGDESLHCDASYGIVRSTAVVRHGAHMYGCAASGGAFYRHGRVWGAQGGHEAQKVDLHDAHP